MGVDLIDSQALVWSCSWELWDWAGKMPTPQELEQDEGGLGMSEPKFRMTERRLPHWELEGAVYVITFNTWEKLELTPEARQIVLDACLFFDRQRYNIFVLVVMPDHVHLLIQPLQKANQEFWALSSIMNSVKGYSAKQIPQVMKYIGTIWQDERYDRIIRDETEFQTTWEYIRQNPVKAGLSLTPEAYPFFWQNSTPSP